MVPDKVISNLEKGFQFSLVYTNYSKLDYIDNSILLNKLAMAGIHGDLLRWLTSYLRNRNHSVVLNGFKSKWIHIPSGVPQNFLLGTLTVCYIHKSVKILINVFTIQLFFFFADNMKICKPIWNLTDCLLLQQDLNEFQNDCVTNKLGLNTSEISLSYLTYLINSRKHNQLKPIYHIYTLV